MCTDLSNHNCTSSPKWQQGLEGGYLVAFYCMLVVKMVKVWFLYSAVSSPLDRSKRFTLFALPGTPVHSDTNSASLGSILAMQQLRATTNQGWVQLHKITSITITITFKYKFQLQLQLHLHNVIFNYNYNYTMYISITITDQFFSRKLHLYLWNFFVNRFGLFSRHLVSYHVWDKKPP